MTERAIASAISRAVSIAQSSGLAVVRDPFGILDVECGDADAICVPYVTPLIFRRQYEPLRHGDSKLIIHVKVHEPFIPDIEARLSSPDQVIEVTPRSILVEATADGSWPQSVDTFGKLVADHLEGIVAQHKAFRSVTKTGFSDEDARRVILSGVTGVQFAAGADRCAVWRLIFTNETGFRDLEKHRVLLDGFQAAVRGMGEPFASLIDGDMETTAQALWTVKVLSQHLPDPLEILPNVSADFFGAQSWPLAEVLSLADGIANAAPDLAREQVVEAESALSSEAIDLISKKLSLSDATKATQAALKEKTSPLVSELSLRYLLSELPHKPTLLPNKAFIELVAEAKSAIAGGASFFAPLIMARPRIGDLLRLLADVTDIMSCVAENKAQVDELEKSAAAITSPKPIVDAYCGSSLCRMDLLASRAQRLTQDVGRAAFIAESVASDLQRRTTDRTAQVVAEAQDLLERLNQVYARAVQANYPAWVKTGTDVKLVSDFVPQTVVPNSYGKASAYILVFDGMRWDAWKEYVEPEVKGHFDVECSPILAILPSSTGHSRRALFSGKMPQQFKLNDAEDGLLAAAWTDGPSSFETKKDPSPEIALRMHGEGAEVIVFRFTDEILHTFNRDLAYLYEDHVKKIVERDVRQVLESIPKDAVVFVGSDHGFVELGTKYTAIPMDCAFNTDTGDDIKWRYAMLVDPFSGAGDAVSFKPEEIRLSAAESGYVKGSGTVTKNLKQVVLAAGRSHLKRKGKGGPVPQFWHGGVSLQEMVVPCAVLTPKVSADIARVEIVNVDGLDRAYTEGETGEVKVSLVLRGPALMETVEVGFTPDAIAGRNVTLANGETQTVSLPFEATLPEGKAEHTYLLKLQVKLAGKGKTKAPPPRPCKLRVTKDAGKVDRQGSQALDDMFGKPKDGS